MHPDLYEDIQRTLDGIKKELDENPLDSDFAIKKYSYAIQAAMFLEWFVNACLEGEDKE